MADVLPVYQSPEEFLFGAPLYEVQTIDQKHLYPLVGDAKLKVDGYCPYCRVMRTFDHFQGAWSFQTFNDFDLLTESSFGALILKCGRDERHRLRFHYLVNEGTIQKIGQFPSYADIAIDQSKIYSKLLGKEDAAEFHKALGLAAHGVGIGSYVYIRRIFERLIQKRFDEFKVKEGWDEVAYQKLRMSDRIEFLKDHLPVFLIKNRRIYSILSLGIHDLDENTCLGFFEVLRTSTIVKRKSLKLRSR
jgi:hypothetical protein